MRKEIRLGEALSERGGVDLDIYAGAITGGVPEPREHAEPLKIDRGYALIPAIPMLWGAKIKSAVLL